ncbi:MAG: 3-hydroxybutyryl-CoA dehydratase [Candidatus Eremiobacteraeota bacterium]|jgi:enoyl-CoA hydratase|nr:3-hydroxybutyryl-CoA dehydratase [Candidatus Eremiobacteraeota bacterium]
MPATISIDRSGAVATVTLNRPAVLNALNLQMLDELSAAFAELDADDALRAVIVTGAGPKAFAAGADISELNALPNARAGEAQARRGQALTTAIERMRVPVIAAVNGFALGGGCEIAMACDIRIAAENAKFGQPEVNLGILPGYGGTQRLTRLVGEGWAMYLCLTGEMIDAAEALRIGLVQKVTPADGLMGEAQRIAALIASKAPLAIDAAKRAIVDGAALTLADGLALEALRFGTAITTSDFREGSSAFLEKRKAEFTGR